MHLQKPKKNLFSGSETASGSFFSLFIYLMIFFGHFSAHFPQFGTFFRINMCDVILLHVTASDSQTLLTHLTSDTSYGTYAHNVFSFIFGAALYEMLLFIWYKLDQMFWTGWRYIYHMLYMLLCRLLQFRLQYGLHQTDMPLHSFRNQDIHKYILLVRHSASWLPS